MGFYAGIDLHSTNSSLAVMDLNGRRVFKKKVANQGELILSALEKFKHELVGVVVESTYNWYWLVDLMAENGYAVHLANPCAIRKYSGLKHSDDEHDAFWLADMLRLGILPVGYIYPKEERPVRDLLRKRGHLVRLRTSLILSLQNIVARNFSIKISSNDIKRLTENTVAPLFKSSAELAMAGSVSKQMIDGFTQAIRMVETSVEQKVKLKDEYRELLTMPGIGKILALTIMLETGPISRFPKVGNYSSYCRKVSSKWTSNEKSKGKGNVKNGNKYLAWAFSEAAEMARRLDERCRAYYNRKKQKTNFMIAHQALSHKLTRAAYYVMKEQTSFEPEKLFAC